MKKVFFLSIILVGTAMGAADPDSAGDENGVDFQTLHVLVDAGEQRLAAYQLEWRASDPRVLLVGVEGGEHEAFTNPPYYDPRALQNHRVILASFNTAEESRLPKGRTRVATLHLMLPKGAEFEDEVLRARGATANGEKIEIQVTTELRSKHETE